MRAFSLAAATLLSTTALTIAAPALAQAAPAAAPAPAKIVADPAAPKGKLSDVAVPSAYRLAFTILPDQPRFSGHDEIDVTLKAATKSLYMHGRDLNVALAVAHVGGKTIPASWTQVDSSGVVRLDFAAELPAGAVTLAFDYDGAFGDSASGLYRIKVGGIWYSWTQFESIDARAAYPSFDEPGFKTPFTISVLTAPGNVVVSNAPELKATTIAVDSKSPAATHAAATGEALPTSLVRHDFEPTKPLPTYLVALVTGPFLHPTGAVPPTPERGTPLPLGVVATQAQKGKLDFAMAETPPIVALLEKYFGESFPFPKLDQIASPVSPGAMENAGADVYGDGILLLDPGATTGDKKTFGMVVAHELSHQWFGDLVSPAWWDDIWLNESFANWMGYRIGNEWKPELKINVGALDEGFSAMNTDALEVGRPIHQPILENGQIDGAFDNITYGKGGQVVAMIAAYLGDDKFRDGVRLHLKRHAYGNSSSEQFFQSLADSAGDPRVLAALKSFVDQPGVPLVTVTRSGGKLTLSQSRYAFLGSTPKAQSWTIPVCLRVGDAKQCTLVDQPTVTVPAAADGVVMPNVGGTGYYRFDLPAKDWKALIASSAALRAGEAIATTDSLWAAFRAGKAPASWLIDEARVMAANPSSTASPDGGQRLAGLRIRGLIAPSSETDYRRVMASIYAPRLAELGFDPRAGADAADEPDRRALRQTLVGLVAGDAHDEEVRARLEAAAEKYLAGDKSAIDQAYLGEGLGVIVEKGGVPAAKRMIDLAVTSEDAAVRQAFLGAAASSGRPDVAQYLLDLDDKRLRSFDRLGLLFGMVSTVGTRDMTSEWILNNYEKLLASGNGVFITSRLPQALRGQCSIAAADRIEAVLGPKVHAAHAGELDFARTLESIRHCAALKDAKGVEIAAALAAVK